MATLPPDDDFEQFHEYDAPHPPSDDAVSWRSNKIKANPEGDSEWVRSSQKRLSQRNQSPKQKWADLTPDELRMKTRARAVYFLSRREYGQKELKQKLTYSLRDTPVDQEMIDEVLAYMQQHNWQSDERFVEQRSKVKAERYGISRIKHELSQTGVAPQLIAQQMEQLSQTELKRAREVWRRKFGQAPRDFNEKAKQIRFMAQRGFSFDMVRRIIDGVDDVIDE